MTNTSYRETYDNWATDNGNYEGPAVDPVAVEPPDDPDAVDVYYCPRCECHLDGDSVTVGPTYPIQHDIDAGGCGGDVQ